MSSVLAIKQALNLGGQDHATIDDLETVATKTRPRERAVSTRPRDCRRPLNSGSEIEAAAQFGMFEGGQQMAALLALIHNIHNLGLPAAQGPLLTTAFDWELREDGFMLHDLCSRRLKRRWSPRIHGITTRY